MFQKFDLFLKQLGKIFLKTQYEVRINVKNVLELIRSVTTVNIVRSAIGGFRSCTVLFAERGVITPQSTVIFCWLLLFVGINFHTKKVQQCCR